MEKTLQAAQLKVSKFQKQIMVSKVFPKTNQTHFPGRLLAKVSTKRESMFFLQEDILSFVLTLR